MRGKVEVINDVIHERKVLDKAALDRMRKQLYGVWTNGYSRGKADAESYLLRCGDETPITNADRIRAMSDEELAEFLEIIPHCGNPPTYTTDGFCIDDGLKTKRQWLDWLKQEASE